MDNSLTESRRKIILNSPHIASASGSIVSIDDAIKAKLKSCVVDINPVQSGTGDPSPDNKRPISGWTGCNVIRTGFNVWDEQWELGTINNNTGKTTNSNIEIRCKNFISVKPNTAYGFTIQSTANGLRYYWYENNDENTFISSDYTSITDKYTIVTSPVNAHYLKIRPTNSYGVTYNNDISINYPSTDRDYHAYTGTTYPITFPSEVGTVYSGILDVVSGVLRVEWKMVDLGNLSWLYQSINQRFYSNTIMSMIKGSTKNAISSMYVVGETTTTNYTMQVATNGYLYIKNTTYTDPVSFKTAMNGVQLVYELNTPLTYQLTPTQINTLLGVNNIWADTGDTSVKYWAHP